MRTFYFYNIIGGFFAGIFFANSFGVMVEVFALVACVASAITVFLFMHSRVRSKDLAHQILIFCVFIFTFALGGVRMNVKQASFDVSPLEKFAGQTITLAGVAQDDVGVTDSSAIVAISALEVDGKVEKISQQKVLLKFPGVEMDYGDLVVFSGQVAEPENFKTDHGEEFDYVSYLKKDGVQYVVSNPKIIHQEAGATSLFSVLHSIKRWFIGNVESVVPEPESALAAGVTIAGKGALPADVKDDFIRSGVIHIVVLSGYNIAVVIAAMMAMFGFLGRRWASAIAITAVWLFIVLSGGAAPVVRSAIMAGIAMIGTLSYTPVLQNRALFGAAFFMVLWNPLLLTSDASFALSFLATFAIVNLVKIVEPMLSFASDKFQIKKILSETLATQIFVMPYLLYQIGRLSIIAPISNLVILPLIPLIMLLCFIVGVVAFIPFISLPLAGILTVLAWLVVFFAHIFASLPFASLNISISLWTIMLLYIIYFTIGIYLTNKKSLGDKIAKAT